MHEDMQLIHDASMQILAECGIKILHPGIRELIKEAGIKVEGEIVHFAEDQLMKWVEKAPSSFKMYARNPQNDLEFGGNHVHFAPGYGAASIIELDGRVRPGLMDDYMKFIKIFHQSDVMNLVGGIMVQPSDIDSSHCQPVMSYLTLANSDKCLMAGTGTQHETQTILEMLAIAFGGRDELINKPRVTTIINMNSPLILDHSMLENMIEYVKYGQPVVVASCTMAGSTGPITLAGTIALSNAEILTGIAVTQILRAGTPVFYGNQTTTADMRTGSIACGSPEGALCYATTARLAKDYGIPCRGGGAVTDARKISVQSGYESMMTLMAAANAGMNLIIHSAGIMDGYNSMSFEQCMVDLEIIGMVKRYIDGIKITKETLAVDVIKNIGIGGHFLSCDHTITYCRQEPFSPSISLRGRVTGDPNKVLMDNIAGKMAKIIAGFQKAELPADLDREIVAFLISRGYDPRPYL